MHLNHSEKTSRPLALVTGASSGIGADLARELARDGYDLVLVARREELMRTLATELMQYGAHSTIIAMNLGTCLAASRLAAELASRGLREPDVLVNNAGFGDCAEFLEAEPTKLSEMLHLNVVALTELTRLLLPAMAARHQGRILLVGARSGCSSAPGAAVYNATKAYVVSLGESLAQELRGSGVTVTTLCPGPTSSGFRAAAGGAGEAAPGCTPLRTMKSSEVARQGYLAMKKGTRVVTPGLGDRLRAIFSRPAR